MESSTMILISQDISLIENTKQWAENHSLEIQVFSPNEWENKEKQTDSEFSEAAANNVSANNVSFLREEKILELQPTAQKEENILPSFSFENSSQSLDSNSCKNQASPQNKDLNKEIKKVRTMEELENLAIQGAIREFNGNLTEAAKGLGIGRATLYRKVKQYKIDLTATRKRKIAS